MSIADRILNFFSFSTAKDTVPEIFAYYSALALLGLLVLLVLNLVVKIYYREKFFTCGTMALIVAVPAILVLYWASAKIPSSVEMIWQVIQPKMNI